MSISFRRSALLSAAASLFSIGLGGAIAAAPRPAAAADWPQYRGDIQRTGVTEEKLAPPLSLLWRYTSAPQTGNPSAPVVVGDTVYFGVRASAGGGGMLVALDTRTGAQKWRYPNNGDTGLFNRAYFSSAPTVDNGMVYVGGSDGYLYVIDARNGQEVRKFRTGGPVQSAPAIVNGVLYFGSNDDTFYALDPETGNMAWRQMYKAGDDIISPPVFSGNMVFFTTNDQHVHGLNATTGLFRYRYRLPNRALLNAPIVAESTLYVPAGRRILALQPTSGSVRWARDMSSEIQAPPVATEGIVYVIDRSVTAASETRLHALRANNGRDVWSKPIVLPHPPSAAPTIAGNIIYIPTTRNTILALDRDEGTTLWQYTIKPSPSRQNAPLPAITAVTTPLTIANGAMYALTDDGSLSAFRPDAPDSTGPLSEVVWPLPGMAVSGAPGLPVAARVSDPGSGLDMSSVQFLLDGQERDAVFDPATSMVVYRTPQSTRILERPALPNGRHSVTIVAKDYRGNVRETSWSFVVDNSLPPPRSRETPAIPTGVRAPGATGTGAPGAGNTGNQRGPRGGNRGGGAAPGRNPATPPTGGNPPAPPTPPTPPPAATP